MDYLYSQLNKQVETATYQGRSTGTVEIIVDNVNYLISANVLDIPQYYITLVNNIRDDLDIEIARATSVEQSLSQNLNAEINRAAQAERQIQLNLTAESERAVEAETQLTQELDAEVLRATASEQGIQANVTSVATDLAVEKARAQNAETTIATNLAVESQRATARENAIQNALSEDISAEAAARVEADNLLQSTIDGEQSRAEQAEYDLGAQLDTEATTRQQSDEQLSLDISTEEARATISEQNLQNNIEAEASTRTAADTTLQANITAENVRATDKETAIQNELTSHIEDINNPHSVTKSQVGLSEVDNTSDANKPVSIAAQTALDLKLDRNNANQNITKDITVNVDGDNVYADVTYINLDTNETSGPTSRQLPLADTDNAGLMATADYTTLYDLKDRVENLEGKTTRLLYTASITPSASDINAFVIAEGYTAPFEGIAVVVDETFHIWHYYENNSIGWKDDGVDTVSTFTNDTAGIIQGSIADGKVFAETDGTGSVNGWGSLKGRVTTLESDINALETTVAGTNLNLNQTMQDVDELEIRVYDSTVDAEATATTVEPTQPAAATATVEYDETLNKYTYSFDFDIPKGEVGDAECTEVTTTGIINYTVEQETDKTFTSDQITALNIIIPSQMFHGFYAGINFRTGTTPPTISVTGETGLAFPIKLLKRSGIQVQEYVLNENCNELMVIMCDGINVYCNLMEVN